MNGFAGCAPALAYRDVPEPLRRAFMVADYCRLLLIQHDDLASMVRVGAMDEGKLPPGRRDEKYQPGLLTVFVGLPFGVYDDGEERMTCLYVGAVSSAWWERCSVGAAQAHERIARRQRTYRAWRRRILGEEQRQAARQHVRELLEALERERAN